MRPEWGLPPARREIGHLGLNAGGLVNADTCLSRASGSGINSLGGRRRGAAGAAPAAWHLCAPAGLHHFAGQGWGRLWLAAATHTRARTHARTHARNARTGPSPVSDGRLGCFTQIPNPNEHRKPTPGRQDPCLPNEPPARHHPSIHPSIHPSRPGARHRPNFHHRLPACPIGCPRRRPAASTLGSRASRRLLAVLPSRRGRPRKGHPAAIRSVAARARVAETGRVMGDWWTCIQAVHVSDPIHSLIEAKATRAG